MRTFVIVGQRAIASSKFRLDDIPGTSGRLDVLLRCTRAAMLLSHDVRKDAVIYLVMQAGPSGAKTIRLTGSAIRFLRPDERVLGSMVKKALERLEARQTETSLEAHVAKDESHAAVLEPPAESTPAFLELRDGLAIVDGGLTRVLSDLERMRPYAAFMLDAGGEDVRRSTGLDSEHVVLFIGDQLGFDAATREALRGVPVLSIGPRIVQAEDAVSVMNNELDRRPAHAER